MVYFDRIVVSEGTDVIKTSASKIFDSCQYWYFLFYKFRFQPNACNRCHDLLITSVNLSRKGSDYPWIITGISKSEAIKLLKIIDLTEKRGTL